MGTDQWSLGARIALTGKTWLEYTFSQPRSELADAYTRESAQLALPLTKRDSLVPVLVCGCQLLAN